MGSSTPVPKASISMGVEVDGVTAQLRGFFVQRAIIGTMSAPAAMQNDPIVITPATDGSGVGAAVIAAMTIERVKKGDLEGIRQRQTCIN